MARPRKQVYTMNQYLENVRDGYVTNDADTQRNPAWKAIVDGLAVTILTDDYIPAIILADEDCGQTHIVDGGSRTGAFQMLRFGNHKVKSSVEDPIISYNKMVKDENGKTRWEEAEFDIRNKTFEQFPKELQKKFDEYQIETVVHEHCDKEKIARYMKRYNKRKNFTASQEQFLYIPKFAETIRDIIKSHFFVECCDIKENEKENGILERVITESVMIIFHLDKWNKNGKKTAMYLNENSSNEEFDKLYDNISRLEDVVTEKTKVLFNSRDSFIWFAAFNKFTKFSIGDDQFGDFLEAFVSELRNKEVDGKLFDRVDDTGSTKDKSNIITKLNIIESLMREYLHITDTTEGKNETTYNKVETHSEKDENILTESLPNEVKSNEEKIEAENNIESSDNSLANDNESEQNTGCDDEVLLFVKEKIGDDIEDIDIDEYQEFMKVYLDPNNPLYIHCKAALMALTAYAYRTEKDVELATWLENYQKNAIDKNYSPSQDVNYKYIKMDFDNYIHYLDNIKKEEVTNVN